MGPSVHNPVIFFFLCFSKPTVQTQPSPLQATSRTNSELFSVLRPQSFSSQGKVGIWKPVSLD